MDRPDWFHIDDALSIGLLQERAKETCLHKVSIKPAGTSYEEVLTAQMASEFSAFKELRELVLWLKLEREAINRIVALPGFESLVIIFGIEGEGALQGFEQATRLREFACDYDMGEADFLAVAKAPVLEILRCHGAEPTPKAIEAILQMPRLGSLDLEAGSFDDEMAALVAGSTEITHLEVGATKLTAKGLAHISTMKQLEKLDVWANDIDMNDLDCLAKLPSLQTLSIGSVSRVGAFKGERLIEKLVAIPALKHLWLDGVTLDEAQLAHLKERYETVSYGPVDV